MDHHKRNLGDGENHRQNTGAAYSFFYRDIEKALVY